MMPFFYTLFLLTLTHSTQTPIPTDCESATHDFQKEWNAYFADSAKTPLEPADFAAFDALPFFPFDAQFCVVATFTQAPAAMAVEFQTTTNKPRIYMDVGQLHFEINGTPCALTVYQTAPLQTPKKKRRAKAPHDPVRWFLPFKDATNGGITYGGGRYMDLLSVANGGEIVLNFNKAYPPLCAYSSRFSCPIVPEQNCLSVPIEAGLAMETVTK